LNDTRYTSLLAARLLSTLYGGRDIVENGRKRQVIFASTGAVTATLRRNWKFEEILRGIIPPEPSESSGKPRTDHDGIDGVVPVIALTRNNVIQAMARSAALEPWQPGTRSWRHVPQPWRTPDFYENVKRQVREMLTSHRPEHKVSGELHKGSNYGRPYMYKGKPTVHARLSISALTAKDIEEDDVIVDRAVRDILRAKLAEVGGNPKAFEKPENAPHMLTPAGKQIPIRKVRVRETKNPLRVGEGPRERYVASGGIHHVELFVTRDEKRRETWDSQVVQITEAYERRKNRKPVVARKLDGAPEAEFLFSISNDDTIEIKNGDKRKIVRIKKSGENKQIFYVPVNDAHTDADQKKLNIASSKYPSTLKALEPRKVVVDLLGRVHPAND